MKSIFRSIKKILHSKQNRASAKKKKNKKLTFAQKLRKTARYFSLIVFALWLTLSLVGNWYVHHPQQWLKDNRSFLTAPLEYFGNRFAIFSDAMGFMGHDAVYESDEPAPEGQVFFAGKPVRVGNPAPDDVIVLNRDNFVVGWSPKNKCPSWVAYHVTKESRHDVQDRPNFQRDKMAPNCPPANALARSGYDRGHMAPNHAIVSRYGTDAQKMTFLMSNIAPQRPSLNSGIGRELEHSIANFWTARYGEIWVIVGTIFNPEMRQVIGGSGISVPDSFYMLILAQEGVNVRSLAVVVPQEIPYNAFPLHYIVTINELEQMTGYDFLSDLPNFIERPLESDRPTRLWPIRYRDIFKLFSLRF